MSLLVLLHFKSALHFPLLMQYNSSDIHTFEWEVCAYIEQYQQCLHGQCTRTDVDRIGLCIKRWMDSHR